MEPLDNHKHEKLNGNPQFSTFEEFISFLNSEYLNDDNPHHVTKIYLTDQQFDQLVTYLFAEYYPDYQINITDKTIEKADPVLKAVNKDYFNPCNLKKVRLTKRQAEVMTMISHGWTRRELARKFGISPNTMDNHMKNIYAKLGTSNVTQAVRMFRGLPVTRLKNKKFDKV